MKILKGLKLYVNLKTVILRTIHADVTELSISFFFYDVLLTVHLSIFISVINQLDALNFCFTISLFHASTCFEHMCSLSGRQNCITPIGVMIPEAV